MSLHLHIDRGDRPVTMRFSTLPVRIGRGTEAECQIPLSYVSRVHASIHLVDGHLLLQDEGSRTGTWLHDRSRRLQRGARVDLATVGNEFFVGPDLHVRVELHADEPTVRREDTLPGATVGGGLVRTTLYEESNVDPESLDADVVERALLEALADQRRASEHLAKILVQASACGPQHVKRFADAIVEADPARDQPEAGAHLKKMKVTDDFVQHFGPLKRLLP